MIKALTQGTKAYPKISIITPSYNQGEFIAETIESVLEQKYPNLEYIIIDGASTDSTLRVINKYIKNIDFFVSEADSGQAHAINKGFKRATGDIICWLNSDDMLTSGTLFEVARFYTEKGFDFLYGNGIKRYEDGVLKGKERFINTELLMENELTYRDPIQQPSTFWSRKALDEVGQLDELLNYAFDWDFFNKINKKFEFKYIKRTLSIYRIHRLHKSGGGGFNRALEILLVSSRYADEDIVFIYKYIVKNYNKAKILKLIFGRYAYIPFYIISPTLYFNTRVNKLEYLVRMV